jgi:tight adherence protein C
MSRKLDHLNTRAETAQLALLLSVAFDSGLGVLAALDRVIRNARGSTAAKFKRLLNALDLGSNIWEELAELRQSSKDPAVGELVLKLQVALQFGSPLADQLSKLAKSNRAVVAQQLQEQAAKNENLMLLPLVFLILPITVLFAVFPSIQYLHIN